MRILILYQSDSIYRNTKRIANLLKENYLKLGCSQVDVYEFFDMPFNIDDYDHVDMGTYSWDDGEIPPDLKEDYECMDDWFPADMSFGLYGSGDKFYAKFCGALDTLGKKAIDLGGKMKYVLRIELSPVGSDIERIEKYAFETLRILREEN